LPANRDQIRVTSFRQLVRMYPRPGMYPRPKDYDEIVDQLWPSMDWLDTLVWVVVRFWEDWEETIDIPYEDLIYRDLRLVPQQILSVVAGQLLDEVELDRKYKPSLDELKRMCVAGMRVRPYLRDRLGIDAVSYDEPALPPPRRRRRRVILDDD
jgi:hypothetical protein